MKRVIKMSTAWTAAVFTGAVLTGCGGSSDISAESQQSGEGYASLSWNAPATRANGEGIRMGELSGYLISYGRDPEELSEAVRIDDANVMDYVIRNLDQGTWYFTIQVEDIDGLVSAPSQQVSKTI
ncbi:fibronectin type III domain-containing protein [Marinobacter orientalis]|nr:fibronectin type III domain-containing protein [Marinobacter orientalis]